MQQTGIHFTRDFSLTPDDVRQIIKKDALISFADGRIQLELNNMRPTINNVPLPKQETIGYATRNPLITLRQAEQRYRIHYGNNRLAFITPSYVELDNSIDAVKMSIDGRPQEIPFGTIIPVSRNFTVATQKGYRVNVVGFPKPKNQQGDGHTTINLRQLNRKYSIDKAGQLYRVEIYRDERFSGMVLVDFRPQSRKKEPLVAQALEKKTNRIEKHN